MKTKGISIWERHVEHIVLGVALLIFAGFTAMQFIGNPNAVESGNTMLTPQNADAELDKAEQRLLAKLKEGAPSPIEIPVPDNMADAFAQQLGARISTTARLEPVMAHAMLNVGGEVGELKAYREPRISAPFKVKASQYFDALSEEAVLGVPALMERFPAPPYDLTWVTPAAVFDMDEVLAEFDRSNRDEAAIPAGWHNGEVYLVDVRIEREAYVDGVWTNRELLDPMPGRATFREELAGQVDVAFRDRLREALNEPGVSEEMLQPDFFATLLESWAPPDPRIEEVVVDDSATDEELRIARIQRKLNELRSKRDRTQEQIDEQCRGIGERDEDDERPARPPRGGGGRGAGGRGAPGAGAAAGGGGGGGAGRRGSDSDDDRKRMQCEAWQRNLETTEKQISRYEQELAELGEQVDPEESLSDEASGELVIWGHDIDVSHGGTYRYRFTVEIINPFFGRKFSLVEEQQELADSIRMASLTSDWSEPITIEPPLRVFVTNATPPRAAGGIGAGPSFGSATAEIFRFYGGRWWRDARTFEPGQRIGDVQDVSRRGEPTLEIDFGTDWFVADIMAAPTGDGRGDRGGVSGGGALVMLQNLRTGEMQEYVNPAREARSEEVNELRQQVDLAEASSTAEAG